jgi:bifunctional UDP-N-acetylglucosamine pyrophosphorylase/glucosamine-1-phosphate N-acetyltransferase
MSLSAIILAAGKSTRMKSTRPKPLLDVCGRPMLEWILEACWGAGVTRAFVVVGYGKEKVIARFEDDPRITFVEQREQLGTGHAARMCEPHLRDLAGDVFILAGDTPLVRSEVLVTIRDAHRTDHAAATMGTAVVDQPFGYGRIVRDASGEFLEIVEQIDCTPAQAEIREVFPSFYCVNVGELLWALERLTNNNRKGEYYLTDIYSLLRRAGKKVTAVQALTPEDIVAPNTREQLAEADLVMQVRIQKQLLDAGVSIVAPANTYIEAGVTIEPDTLLMPFTFVGRNSRIGAECTIGPFASLPRESIVPAGTTLAGNVSPETARIERD